MHGRALLIFSLAAGAIVLGVAALLVLVVPGLATRAAQGPPHFVEEAAAAGIDHVYDGDFDFVVGGGVAVFDCNADGRPDLYLAGGTRPAALYRNASSVGGELAFGAIGSEDTDLDRVTGAYPLDIDADGETDLAVLRSGENVLLRGLGGCRFERANETWGFDGGGTWSTGFSATWEPGASWPTVAVGNYVDQESDDLHSRCHDNELIRPASDGAAFGPPVPLRPGWCALSLLFSDWDRSGRRDLRISNDRHFYGDLSDGQEQLWRMTPGQAPTLWTEEEGWQLLRIWGMGIASYDLTDDGYPEVFLTSQADNKLQSLVDGPSAPRYGDIALERGVTATRPFAGDVNLPSTAWHPEFADVNNDGYVDLLITKGNVEIQPDFAMRDPSDLMIGQPDGTFLQGAEEAGILGYGWARGAALADLNLDGLLDLVIVYRREPVKLWRNVGRGDAREPAAMGGWIAVRLEQPGANRDAIGSWIEVRSGDEIARREVTVGGGHGGGQLGWIHFGLGGAERGEVRVAWPDGAVGPWLPVEAESFVILRRDEADAETWTPTAPGAGP